MNRHNLLNRVARHAFMLAIMAFLLLVSACRSGSQKSEKPLISVSILPQKYFVERICGDQFMVQVMIPPGESPATYDPTPGQMIQFSKSEIYFLIGHIEFEKSWIRKLEGDYPQIKFFDTSAGIEFENMEHEGNDHSHHGIDPHIWMSALSVKEITANMANFLTSAYPENKDHYANNLSLFHRELDSLHHFIANELRGLSSNEFIIYHPALTYFARDYRLIQIPIENEGKEPSARYLKTLVDRATANNIKAILVQQQFNQEEARTIVKELDGELIVIDPLDYQWKDQMKHITYELKSVLR